MSSHIKAIIIPAAIPETIKPNAPALVKASSHPDDRFLFGAPEGGEQPLSPNMSPTLSPPAVSWETPTLTTDARLTLPPALGGEAVSQRPNLTARKLKFTTPDPENSAAADVKGRFMMIDDTMRYAYTASADRGAPRRASHFSRLRRALDVSRGKVFAFKQVFTEPNKPEMKVTSLKELNDELDLLERYAKLEIGPTISVGGKTYALLEHLSVDLFDFTYTLHDHVTPTDRKWILRSIFRDLLMQLIEQHIDNLVHNDIKPDNAMIRSNGSAALVDFGLSRVLTQKYGDGNFGTLGYVSPEMLHDHQFTHESDMYSLGVTMLVMHSLRPPPDALGIALEIERLTMENSDQLFNKRIETLKNSMSAKDRKECASFLHPAKSGDPRLYAILLNMTAPRPEMRRSAAATFGKMVTEDFFPENMMGPARDRIKSLVSTADKSAEFAAELERSVRLFNGRDSQNET